MAPPPIFGTPLTRFVAPSGGPEKELHPRPHWPCSHAVPSPLRHTPHEDRGPVGSSTEGPSGSVHVRPRTRFVAALTRIMGP